MIAIDGPAGSGKSSTARAVAQRLGLAHLDSGALYRAVTLGVLDSGAPEAGDPIVGLAQSLPVRLSLVDDAFRPEVAGVDVSEAVREARVNAKVSAIAALPAVRDWVNEELRAAADLHPRGVVADGRDIGTVVFPDAPVKIFLTASPEERAKRRSLQAGTLFSSLISGTRCRLTACRSAAAKSRFIRKWSTRRPARSRPIAPPLKDWPPGRRWPGRPRC